MKRIVLLSLLALALPVTAFASSEEFTNSGGTLSGTSAGLTLSGSTLVSVGSITGNGLGSGTFITGNDLGSVTFMTAGLASGSLKQGGMFMAGGTFTITGNGSNSVHNGVIFSGSFSGPVTWTLLTLADGTHNYDLKGTMSGTWYTGATVNGVTVELTLNVGKGFFGRSVTLGSGDTNITTSVVPEPGSLSLLGTGLFGLAGVVRRKLNA